MAAAAVLGFFYLLGQDATYTVQPAAGVDVLGSPPRSPARPFLDYVLSGDGLCLDLLHRSRAQPVA